MTELMFELNFKDEYDYFYKGEMICI